MTQQIREVFGATVYDFYVPYMYCKLQRSDLLKLSIQFYEWALQTYSRRKHLLVKQLHEQSKRLQSENERLERELIAAKSNIDAVRITYSGKLLKTQDSCYCPYV